MIVDCDIMLVSHLTSCVSDGLQLDAGAKSKSKDIVSRHNGPPALGAKSCPTWLRSWSCGARG